MMGDRGPVRFSVEALSFILLLALAVGMRLVFVSKFATIPVSDFRSIVYFGRYLFEHGVFSPGWFWEYFSPGLPLILSVIYHLFPGGDPDTVARLATASACGMVAIVPFAIWRGVLPFWMRVLTALLFAFWPGQILFSGVVSQDNWVILPVVALGSLAVRTLLRREEAWPIAAGLLYGTGVAIRQEMLLVLLPLFVAAAGIRFPLAWRRAAAAAIAAGLLLGALIAYRGAVTGRYSLSSEHASFTILGAYVPGASIQGWVDPYPFIASVRPDLLTDRNALLAEGPRLALSEVRRRPGFHALRIFSLICFNAVYGEATNMFWSLQNPEVLPPAKAPFGAALALRLSDPLTAELVGIQMLFATAVFLGIRRRNAAILVLLATVFLKYAIHGVTAMQGRYFLAATALELLATAVAFHEIVAGIRVSRALILRSLSAGVVFGLALLLAAPRLMAFVQNHDLDPQRTYRFPLALPNHTARMDCTVSHGLLDALILPAGSDSSATISGTDSDAVAECQVTATGAPQPLVLQVAGVESARRVEVDGLEATPRKTEGGWSDIPLGSVGAGGSRKVVVVAHGPGAAATFRLMPQN